MKQTDLIRLLEQNNISKNSYDILDKGFVSGSDGYLVTEENGEYCLFYTERSNKELLCRNENLGLVLDALAQELDLV